MSGKAWDKTIFCHPDDERNVEAALAQLPEANGRVRVLVRTVVPPGQTFVMDDDKIEGLVGGEGDHAV